MKVIQTNAAPLSSEDTTPINATGDLRASMHDEANMFSQKYNHSFQSKAE